MDTNCKICSCESSKVFDSLVLNKYKVDYYQCRSCYFIQTEDPFWLNEAYNSAITKLDIGLIYRNLNLANDIEIILKNHFNVYEKFIDYGGGYGMFVRLMRDKGFDFYRQDLYCPNLFAEFFDITDLSPYERFEVLTAFEVFEHLVNPIEEIKNMLSLSDTIIFSTELQPTINPTPETWWYFVVESGQHISLFSRKSLEELSIRFNLNLYSNNNNLHLLSKKKLTRDPFLRRGSNFLWNRKVESKIHLQSRLLSDYEYIRKKIK